MNIGTVPGTLSLSLTLPSTSPKTAVPLYNEAVVRLLAKKPFHTGGRTGSIT